MLSKSIDLSTVDREQLPVGVSRMQASRMHLDVKGSPAMLDLRMNYRNLLNEMHNNGGRIVSHQFALMKPRKKISLETKVPEPPVNCDVALYERVARKKAREKKREERALQQSVVQKPKTPPNKAARDAEDAGILFELDGDDETVMFSRDPTAALEVQDMLHDERTAAVFQSLQDKERNGFIQQTSLPRALEALGITDPDPEQMQAGVKSLIRYDASSPDMPLAFDEFCAVVWSFISRRQEALRDTFKSLDRDGSGAITCRELRHLMWELGFNVNEEAVQEIVAEVDSNRSGQVELPEFEAALRIVHQRHGFTKAEAAELLSIFDRYDVDKSGHLSSSELASGLGWFGTPTTIKEAKEIIRKYDQDVDGTLCRCEFLLIMRSRLEEEIIRTRTLFAEFDTDSRGALTNTQLSELLKKLGYTVPAEVLAESIKELGPANAVMGLVFEDVCRVTATIRMRNGFSKSEVAQFVEIYTKFDKLEKGEMREFELAHALNWLGFPISHQRRRKLWCMVDMDKSNSIDQGEFLKLVRMLREEETQVCRDLLEKRAGKGKLRDKVLRELMSALGYSPTPDILNKAAQDYCSSEEQDLLNLLSMLQFIREKQVANLRESAGLTDHLATKIKLKFKSKLESGKRVDPSDFERFMFDLWKSARSSYEEREKIKELIRDHCIDGALGLQEMYWVVRLYGDLVEEGKVEEEKTIKETVGFDEAQVAEFRVAFLEADADESGELDEEEILSLFDDVANLDANQAEVLTCELERLGDKRDAIDFGMFLQLMSMVCIGEDSD